MSEITSLKQYKIKQGPHATGPLICMGCDHTWIATYPLPAATAYDCPRCTLEKGIPQGLFSTPEGSLAFECLCSSANQRFVLTPEGALCEMCGAVHPWDQILDFKDHTTE